MKSRELCKSGSVFLFIGITSLMFSIAPVYFLGKRLVLPDAIRLNTAELIILYGAMVWVLLSILLAGTKRSSYLLSDFSIIIQFSIFGFSIKKIDLGNANECSLWISENSVRFKHETKDCINIMISSLKTQKTHVLGTYLSTEEAQKELDSLEDILKKR